jgi:hypothetical protein
MSPGFSQQQPINTEWPGRLNCCWSLPAQLFLASFHEHDCYSFLDLYVFRIGTSSPTSEVSVKVKVIVKVMLRPTVSRPVSLGVRHPSGIHDEISITVRQLRVCWCERRIWRETASSVYNCCWASPAQYLLSQIRDSLRLDDQISVFTSPRQWVPISSPLKESQGCCGGTRPLPHGVTVWLKSKFPF